MADGTDLNRRTYLAVTGLAALAGCAGDDDGGDGDSDAEPDTDDEPTDIDGDSDTNGDTDSEDGQPSFSTENVDAPSQVEAGANVEIAIEVSNTGDASGETTVELSIGGTSYTETVTLDAGASTTVAFVHEATESGELSYEVAASPDDAGATGTITVQELEPEFAIVNVDAPDTVAWDETWTWSFTVENQGDAAGDFEAIGEVSRGETTEWFEVEDPFVIEDVEPGETATWESGEISDSDPGVIQIRFSEYNVQFEVTIEAPSTDIQITGTATSRPIDDFYDSMAEVRIENQGDAVARNVEFSIDWYDSGGQYHSTTDESVPGLGPGETWAFRTEERDVPTDPDRIEVTVTDVTQEVSFDDERLEVENSDVLISADEVRARFTVTHLQNEEATPEIVVHLWNENDVIIGGDWYYEEFGPNESRTVEVTPDAHGRQSEVERATLRVFPPLF